MTDRVALFPHARAARSWPPVAQAFRKWLRAGTTSLSSKGVSWRALRAPWFWAGMLVRLVLIGALLPQAVRIWYLPFLGAHTSLSDPWTEFLAQGGTMRAFPYGLPTFLALKAGVSVAEFVGLPARCGYGLSLLLADLSVMGCLRVLRRDADATLGALYWLSPISIFALYWLGFNDIIPILFVLLCLAALRAQCPRLGAAFAAVAVAAKLSMLITLPFVAIFLIRNNKYRAWVKPFALWLGVGLVVLHLPYAYSPGARAMLFQNPEPWKALAFKISWANGMSIFILPLLYWGVLFWAWQVRRMSFDLLLAMVGSSFFLVLTLTPAPAGWFVWVLPFLVLHQWQSGSSARWLALGYSALYVGFQLAHSPLPHSAFWPNAGDRHLSEMFGLANTASSLWQTTLLGVGLLIFARMLREGIYRNEYFRLSRTPFVLAIAGDSGAGKDTLALGLNGLFGAHSVAHLHGDDYHLWDRQKPIWQVMTHLNPQGSDLEQLATDIRRLTDGRSVRVPRYDHDIGRKTKPTLVESNDFVIVSGLHVLYAPMLREQFELSIFLDMDEALRNHFKIARDTGVRGHSRLRVLESIRQRAPDSQRYIQPQAAFADLTLSLRPIHPSMLEGDSRHLRLKLVGRMRHGMHYRALVRVLVGLCGLQVDVVDRLAEGPLEISVEGDVSAEDVEASARELIPQLEDLLDLTPRWASGMAGLMQLIVLVHVEQALRKRMP